MTLVSQFFLSFQDSTLETVFRPFPQPLVGPSDSDLRENLYRANGRGRPGGQTARGHRKAFPRPRKPLLAVPASRELESACRVSIARCCHKYHWTDNYYISSRYLSK